MLHKHTLVHTHTHTHTHTNTHTHTHTHTHVSERVCTRSPEYKHTFHFHFPLLVSSQFARSRVVRSINKSIRNHAETRGSLGVDATESVQFIMVTCMPQETSFSGSCDFPAHGHTCFAVLVHLVGQNNFGRASRENKNRSNRFFQF